MKMLVLAATLFVVAPPVHAHDYYNQKWFDYPDGPSRAIDGGCGRWVRIFNVDQCLQPNLPRVELRRRDVKVIVSGPDTADQAIRNALVGYAAGCVATAALASTAGPQLVAAPAGFFAAFKACVLGLSLSGVAGGIAKQFEIRLDSSETHWSPL